MNRELKLFDELDRFSAGQEISHALALTYGYDGDVANERIWTPLIERYGLRHPLVIADGVVDEGTALGVHVLRARPRRGVFHPKLLLAVRDEAVFVALGSANLTRGGLGGNLELVTTLHFTRDAERCPPRSVLEAVLAFLDDHVTPSLEGRAAPRSLAVAREVVRHGRLVAETLPLKAKGPELAFVHSYDEPLWEQLRRFHGADPVGEMVVVSPFFEQEDPASDPADSLLHEVIDTLRPAGDKGTTPWLRLHVAPLGAGSALPVSAIRALPAKVLALWPQRASVEPRRLHAKLVGLVGRKRTTLLWGSPNFTPAALRRTGSVDGNVECGLLLAAPSTGGDVLAELQLAELFHLHRGAIPDAPVPTPRSLPAFALGEVVYDPETRVLTALGEVFESGLNRLVVTLLLVDGEAALLDTPLDGIGPFACSAGAPSIEEEDPETGLRRLRSALLRIDVLDASGAVVASQMARVNVAFDDALEVRQNKLLGKQALTADALLVPANAPPERRVREVDQFIASKKAARSTGRVATSRHQASLDSFFRNVRHGLDARLAGLQRKKGSRYALLRWSVDLRRALAATQPPEAARQVYLMTRLFEHVSAVLGQVPAWHSQPAAAFAAIEPEKLADALAAVSVDETGLDRRSIEEHAALRRSVLAELRRIS